MKPPRILIVEDQATSARDLAERLADAGYQPVAHTGDAHDALRLATELQPDLILLGTQLPGGVDGTRLGETLRSTLGIPIVFLTAYADVETLERARRTSPYGWLAHPLEDQELRQTIDGALARHRADQRARVRTLQLQAVLDTARDGYFLVDLQGRIREVNEAFVRLTGFDREDLLRMTIADLEADETPAEIQAQVRRVIEAGSARFERRLRTRNGALIRLEVHANYLPIQDGRILGFICDAGDPRPPPEPNLALHQDPPHLESGVRIAAATARVFRNLLDRLRRDLPPSTPPLINRPAPGESPSEALAHLDRLTRRLECVARQANLRLSRLDLGGLLTDLAPMLRNLLGEAIQLDLQIEPHLPPIEADVPHLEEVILELCRNARDALPDGGSLLVQARIHGPETAPPSPGHLSPPTFVGLAIRDSGPGLPERIQQCLFDPFVTTKDSRLHPGLGLAAAYGFLRQLGGWLDIDTHSRPGTSVTLLLPAAGFRTPASPSDASAPSQ